jgi:hypothetical protein
MSDIEYKTGDADLLGVQLLQYNRPIDLTGYEIKFVMKHTSGSRIEIPCTLNGVVDGVYVPGTSGGVTVPFTSAHLATAGNYRGEFVITKGTSIVAHLPNGNNYYTITIWESL